MEPAVRRRLRPAAAAVALVALLVAACGGGASPSNGVARLDSPSPAASSAPTASPSAGADDGYEGMLAYSQCMREHGVPTFPDPIRTGNGGVGMQIQGGPGTGLDPNSPTFQAAQQACQALMPTPPPDKANGQQSEQEFQQMLAFSQCMRDHGVPHFPDPQRASGGGTTMEIDGSKGSDLNPSSPTFQAAQEACKSLAPGMMFGGGPAGNPGSGPVSGGAEGGPATSSQP